MSTNSRKPISDRSRQFAMSVRDWWDPGFWLVLVSLVILALWSGNGMAATLKELSYQTLPSDLLQIHLHFTDAVPNNPTAFTIDNPARIAIDLPDTGLATSSRRWDVNAGAVNSIRAVEAGGRTRLVLSLSRMVPYTVTQMDGEIVVQVRGSQGDAISKAPQSATMITRQVSADSATSVAAEDQVQQVDFRRGRNGEGRLVLTLGTSSAVVDIQERGGRIIANLKGVRLPHKLERRLDVTDFGTPVSTIDAYNSDDGVRLVVSTSGEFTYQGYQSGNSYAVEVKPKNKQGQSPLGRAELGYTGEKLSLNFQSIDVRAVLQLLADFTGLNIVASDTVQGSITLRLKNVPWDQAMDIILKTRGLAMRQVGNVVLVAPSEELASREQLELEAKKQLEGLSPLRTEFFQVNYAKASDLVDILKADGNSLLSERGSVTVDSRTNTLMIQDTQDKLDDIRSVIAKLYVPVRQVLIEARIVVANDDFSRELGSRFGVTSVGNNSGGIAAVSGSATGTDTMVNSALSNYSTTGQAYPVATPTLTDRLNVNLAATSSSAGRFALAILGSDYLVDLELSALQSEGRGEVVSNPRVITSNQKEATIKQGVQIPYQESSSSGASTVSFKDATLSLGVTPQITPDDRVNMELKVSKDNVGTIYNGVPSIETRSVTTQVLIDNGDTVVLGGIYEQSKVDGIEKIPFFGDLPVLGHLFRRDTKKDNKAELLIFVTPKILKEGMAAQ